MFDEKDFYKYLNFPLFSKKNSVSILSTNNYNAKINRNSKNVISIIMHPTEKLHSNAIIKTIGDKLR